MHKFDNALTELFDAVEITHQHIADHLTEEYKQEQYAVLHSLRAALTRAKAWRANLLMPHERSALDALCKAWEEYLKLPALAQSAKQGRFPTYPWSTHDFMQAIHSAQQVILTRCAKRILDI